MAEQKDHALSQKRDFPHAGHTESPPSESEKTGRVDELEPGPGSTYFNEGAAAGSSEAHREYLIQRHGTLELDPIPSADPADPYNWPVWKKTANLTLIAFHAFMSAFMAAGIIPAFEYIALDLGCSLQRASYLVSLQIVIAGFAPFFWKPMSNRYGRRPIWLISTIGSLVGNIGCAVSPTYASMAACRALVAFFISPALSIGPGVVTETFFKRQRGKYIGIWALLVTLGPPAGPFFMGFVAYQTGNYRWIYWIYAIINGIQFIAYLFLGPETRYLRQGVTHEGTAFKQEYLTFKRIDPAPFRLFEFVQPLTLFRYPSIVIPSIAYAIIFCFANVLIIVELPQLFLPRFGFNSQQLGLQFLGPIIGSIIGEQLGGNLSDWWMARRAKKINAKPAPEYRLWLSYSGFLFAIVGLVVFCLQTQNAVKGHWNVTPVVGTAIASVGNQIVTTVLVTYAIDSHPEHSSSTGVFINVVRELLAFTGPFYFPHMFTGIGLAGSAGLIAGLIFVLSWVPTAVLHWGAQRWRVKKGGE